MKKTTVKEGELEPLITQYCELHSIDRSTFFRAGAVLLLQGELTQDLLQQAAGNPVGNPFDSRGGKAAARRRYQSPAR